jgi:ubiquinone/menaquinone biosynthesis C-methylase UbiE
MLQKAGVRPGFRLLDFGSGPGGHSIAAAGLVGAKGKVYALDIHPLAAKAVVRKANRKGFGNIQTIQSDCSTGLETGSLDMVLLYDIYHMLGDRRGVLEELHRVLKPGGILSVDDHHSDDNELLTSVVQTGLFEPHGRGKRFLNFAKRPAAVDRDRRK